MNVWRGLWVAWFVFTAITFALLEAAGYSHHGTLSEQVWWWLGIKQNLTVDYLARRIILSAFMFWLYLHLFFEVN